jgi:hypothetical protein
VTKETAKVGDTTARAGADVARQSTEAAHEVLQVASTRRLRTFSASRGTVNLIGSGRDKAHEGWVYQRLYPSGHAGDLGPGLEGLGPGGSILGGRAVIAAEVEEVADLVVGREEALGLAG